MQNNLSIDIKRDSVFKNVFLREEGRRYMCTILSMLLNIDYSDLINNMLIYNTEHPRIDSNIQSSHSDIIYIYKNKLFIIEMNKSYYEKSIYKNHFYLLFRHIFDATNKNNYNQFKETYLIDIDNFDIREELEIESNKKFISYGRLTYEEDNICLYDNIKTIRLNLDYLKKKKYNYDMLSDIERSCIIFVEKDKNLIRKYSKNKEIEGVINLLEVIEIDGKYYPKFDKEEWEESLRQEMKERGLKEGIEQGIVQGESNKTRELALKLKNKNFSYDLIAELTGLSKEKIKNL